MPGNVTNSVVGINWLEHLSFLNVSWPQSRQKQRQSMFSSFVSFVASRAKGNNDLLPSFLVPHSAVFILLLAPPLHHGVLQKLLNPFLMLIKLFSPKLAAQFTEERSSCLIFFVAATAEGSPTTILQRSLRVFSWFQWL